MQKARFSVINYLKLQSVVVASLSPSLFETCNCSYLRKFLYYGLCTGTSSARMNLLSSMCGCQSTTPVWILYSGITDSSLRPWNIWPKQEFYWILSSERVRNKSATFVWHQLKKKTLHKSRTFPQISTSTTQIRKHYYKLTVVNRAKVRR